MRKEIEKSIHVAIILSLSFLIVFISEFLVRADAVEVIRWIKYYDLAFLWTYCFVLAVFLVMVCLSNSLSIGYMLTSLPITIISVVNYYKLDMKGEQLSVQDFALASEFATMAGDLQFYVSMHLVWGCCLAIILALITIQIDGIKFNKRIRSVGILISVGIVFLTYDKLYAQNSESNQSFLLMLVNSAQESKIEAPADYSKEKISEILESYEGKQLSAQKPNVIMIMSESYFHTSTLDPIEFSSNPHYYFDEYSNNFTSGTIIGPKAASYTAQTEYEVLTGNSVDFTGVSNVAYLRYIEPGVHSLAANFEKEGYYTEALHGYDRYFYSRDQVYKDMGFNRFIALDNIQNPSYVNKYVSDRTLFAQIIDSYESQNEKPFFTHVVTMQNHMPYDKLEKPIIKVKNDELTDLTKDTLESYATSVYETDKAFHELVQYFSKVDEPTIIMMYGDHIPVLGDEVYEELMYFDVEDTSDYIKTTSTPFVIWNNYDLPKKNYGYVDSSYLGAILLNEIGFKQDAYFNYLYDNMNKMKAFHMNFYINGSGEVKASDTMTQEEKKYLEELWLLQYDKLFGEDYGGMKWIN